MTTATVNIACPSWCDISREDHERDVRRGEQVLFHLGATDPVRGEWIFVMMQDAEGTPRPEKEGAVPFMLHDGDRSVHPDEAERFAHAVLELVDQARAQQEAAR